MFRIKKPILYISSPPVNLAIKLVDTTLNEEYFLAPQIAYAILIVETECLTMADQSKEKSLEMRVAELEDKLSQLHITEDEMKAFHKVNNLLGGSASTGGGGVAPRAGCILDCHTGCINECAIRACTIVRSCTIRACTIRACTFECGGNCDPGGGGGLLGGGGFGGFGG